MTYYLNFRHHNHMINIAILVLPRGDRLYSFEFFGRSYYYYLNVLRRVSNSSQTMCSRETLKKSDRRFHGTVH